MNPLVLVLFLAAADPADLKAEYRQDFRTLDLQSPVWRQTAAGVERDEKGVRITVPADEGNVLITGLMSNFSIHGDFEATLSYEILKVERPNTGYGVGPNLYAAIDPKNDDSVSLARRLLKEGTTKFLSDRMKRVGGKLTHKVESSVSTALVGKLRLQREGSRVRFLVAEGDNPAFILVDEVEFGTANVRLIQVGGSTGNSTSRLDVRLLDFTVRAEELPGLPELIKEADNVTAPVKVSSGGLFIVAGILACLLLVASLGAWWYARSQQQSDPPREAERRSPRS